MSEEIIVKSEELRYALLRNAFIDWVGDICLICLGIMMYQRIGGVVMAFVYTIAIIAFVGTISYSIYMTLKSFKSI